MSLIKPRNAADKGLKLFCMPMRVPVNAKHLSFLNTASRDSFVFNNVTVETYKWGKGDRKILFLHGWQSHTYRWRKYIEAFDPNVYTIYSMDAPGHGLSGGKFLSVPTFGDAIETFVQKEGAIDAMIGHSMGCFAALYAFDQYPHLTPRAFVGLASPGEATEFVNHFVSLLSLSERTVKLVVRRFCEVFKKTPSDFSAKKFASKLNIPGLLIHDEEDTETNVEHSKNIHAAWKKSTLVITRGLGHNLRSADVVKQVSIFIEESIGHLQTR